MLSHVVAALFDTLLNADRGAAAIFALQSGCQREDGGVQVGHLHLRHYHTRRSQRLSALTITLSKLLKKTMMGNFPIAEKNYRSGNPVQITGTTSHSDSSDCIAP
jgi:hypothetical protein